MLIGDQLVYYEDKAKKDDAPNGYIPLHSAVAFEPNGRAWTITTTDPERRWLLRNHTEQDAQKWMNATIIHSKYSQNQETVQISQKQETPMSTKVKNKEGYLEKLAGGVSGKVTSLRKGLQWRKRYFRLKDGILFKYKDKESQKPESKYPLYKCKFEEYQTDPNSTSTTQFTITVLKKEIILRAETEEEMQEWLNTLLVHRVMIEQIIDGIVM